MISHCKALFGIAKVLESVICCSFTICNRFGRTYLDCDWRICWRIFTVVRPLPGLFTWSLCGFNRAAQLDLFPTFTQSELSRRSDHAGTFAWRRVPQLRGWHNHRANKVPRLPWWLVSAQTFVPHFFSPTVLFRSNRCMQTTRLHTVLFSDCSTLVRQRISLNSRVKMRKRCETVTCWLPKRFSPKPCFPLF